MEVPDELGVLADLHRVATVEKLVNILWEIIANRKWNPDKSLAKFLFAQFDGYFILGTNHHRTKDSIEKEHTPFKFNQSRGDTTASISARGYGAKLLSFYVGGKYSNLFSLKDSDTFSSDPNEWGMKQWINMKRLGNIIDYEKEKFKAEHYRSQYFEPLTEMPGKTMEKPFFLEKDFVGSALDEFIHTHNFKYFYVFTEYTTKVSEQLDGALLELARIYEHQDVELYTSNNVNIPTLVRPERGFGLHPTNWSGAIDIQWRLGDKVTLSGDRVKTYYKSEFCFRFHGSENVIWGRVESNGSATDKFACRFASFEPPEGWVPQARIIVALTTQSYRDSLGENEEKFQEYIHLVAQNDLISRFLSDPTISSKLRHLKEPSRIRVIVEILEESLKNNPESGLVFLGVKSKSSIHPGKGLHEMMMHSLVLMHKHLMRCFEHVQEEKEKGNIITIDADLLNNEEFCKKMEGDINKNKKANTRAIKRKREGLKYEKAVSDYLETQYDCIEYGDESCPITWEDNDATIMAEHGLESQGIDTLGKLTIPSEGRNVWISVQSKDRESSVPAKELDAFCTTVQQLKDIKLAINPTDSFISVLSLAKKKSFNYENYEKLLEKGIITVIDSETAGKKTLMAIESMIGITL